MNPWVWWTALWTRAAMLPLAMMAGLPPARADEEEYLVRELREDLELQGVQGIIDEGGHR